MITLPEYEKWRLDSRRDQHRLVLMELDYSDREIIAGHGRSNFSDNLNEIKGMELNVYGSNFIELTFSQPTSQEGYSWEVWLDGVVQDTIQNGDWSFTGIEDQPYQIAVCSVRGEEYSKPWIIEFTPHGVEEDYYGSVGDWQDVGAGTGTTGTGRIYLSSFPWISDQGIVYDDFITTEPEIEQSIDDFEGVGDFRARNPTREINWRDLYWSGHICTWLHGDEAWKRDDFRTIASPMIDDVRLVDDDEYQIDLMDAGQQFKRRFALNEIEMTSNVFSMLEFVADKAGLPDFNYTNVPNSKWDYSTYMKLDEESKIEDVVRTITACIRASIRINQSGGIDIFIPEVIVTKKLNEDDIVMDQIRQIGSTPAAKRVVVEMALGNSVKATTTASTGMLVETVTIKTVLNNFIHANQILQEYVAYYSVPHTTWEIGILDISGELQVGDRLFVDHEQLKSNGTIKRIRRRPLSLFSYVDIET